MEEKGDNDHDLLASAIHNSAAAAAESATTALIRIGLVVGGRQTGRQESESERVGDKVKNVSTEKWAAKLRKSGDGGDGDDGVVDFNLVVVNLSSSGRTELGAVAPLSAHTAAKCFSRRP